MDASERVRRQRAAWKARGWKEIRVWVSSPEDAKLVRELAARLLDKARAKKAADLKQEMATMESEALARAAKAIAKQGSAEYVTPSGATLDLLSELAAEGNLVAFSKAFVMFANMNPGNARFVARWVPAKISNQYFFRKLNLDVSAFQGWAHAHPDWEGQLAETLQDSELFANVVQKMAKDIRAFARKH